MRIASSPLQVTFVGPLRSQSYAVLYVLTHLIPTKAYEAGSLIIPFKDKETEYHS